MTMKLATVFTFFAITLFYAKAAYAGIFGGINFPEGTSSFADLVIRYEPLFSGGPAPTELAAADPQSALGTPDFPAGGTVGDLGSVSLGNGGLIELAFTNNLLTNDSSTDKDLHIFEIGTDVEDTFVAIRPTTATLALLSPAGDANSDGFFEIGKVFGSTSSIDIDAFFPGFAAGELAFDAVQLIDDPFEGGMTGPTVGADIDAVGAIASTPVPEPSSTALAGLAVVAFGVRRTRFKHSH